MPTTERRVVTVAGAVAALALLGCSESEGRTPTAQGTPSEFPAEVAAALQGAINTWAAAPSLATGELARLSFSTKAPSA